jgi:hypothetical protein
LIDFFWPVFMSTPYVAEALAVEFALQLMRIVHRADRPAAAARHLQILHFLVGQPIIFLSSAVQRHVVERAVLRLLHLLL